MREAEEKSIAQILLEAEILKERALLLLFMLNGRLCK
jgi:hypothetical protein